MRVRGGVLGAEGCMEDLGVCVEALSTIELVRVEYSDDLLFPG